MRTNSVAAIALLLLACTTAQAVPRQDCFPIEQLPAELQPQARKILLKALDTEALYTIAAPIKPLSSDIHRVNWKAGTRADLVSDLQRIARAFRCGKDLEGAFHIFDEVIEGRQYGDFFFARRSRVKETIAKNTALFARFGLSTGDVDHLSLTEIMRRIDRDRTFARMRALGLLFGYPQASIEHFMKLAELDHGKGTITPRQFTSIPTFKGETGYFIWVVPPNHRESQEEKALRTAAAPVLTQYKKLRKKWGSLLQSFGPVKSIEIVRDWFNNGLEDYDPAHADLKNCATHLK